MHSTDRTVRRQGDLVSVDLHGSLTQPAGPALRDAIRTLVQAGFQRVLLNMSEVGGIDSSGIGELLLARAEVASSGGTLRLVNLRPAVADLFQATGLSDIFGVREDDDSAFRGTTNFPVYLGPGSEYFLG